MGKEEDYEEVLADHRRLVRELDVLLNGEEGAAKQASLCDIVAQVRRQGISAPPLGDGGGDLEWKRAAHAVCCALTPDATLPVEGVEPRHLHEALAAHRCSPAPEGPEPQDSRWALEHARAFLLALAENEKREAGGQPPNDTRPLFVAALSAVNTALLPSPAKGPEPEGESSSTIFAQALRRVLESVPMVAGLEIFAAGSEFERQVEAGWAVLENCCPTHGERLAEDQSCDECNAIIQRVPAPPSHEGCPTCGGSETVDIMDGYTVEGVAPCPDCSAPEECSCEVPVSQGSSCEKCGKPIPPNRTRLLVAPAPQDPWEELAREVEGTGGAIHGDPKRFAVKGDWLEGLPARIRSLPRPVEGPESPSREDVLCQAHGAWNAECPGCLEEQLEQAEAERDAARAELEEERKERWKATDALADEIRKREAAEAAFAALRSRPASEEVEKIAREVEEFLGATNSYGEAMGLGDIGLPMSSWPARLRALPPVGVTPEDLGDLKTAVSVASHKGHDDLAFRLDRLALRLGREERHV